jgi:hypothetical protein
MNHNADKLVVPSATDPPTDVDRLLERVVMEAHTCPACGLSAARPAASER